MWAERSARNSLRACRLDSQSAIETLIALAPCAALPRVLIHAATQRAFRGRAISLAAAPDAHIGWDAAAATADAVASISRRSKVAATVTEAFDTIRAGYTDCIVDAQAAGEVEADADAEALGTYFCAVIEGIAAIGRVGTSRAALLQVGIASLAALPITPLGAEHLGTADGPWD
ncbi:TetR family transcriptional regulator C-terminal domain-containing protein [Curtobacterium sp. ODYSSEY 48 V2]|uniref:TetR family transcriptional regulator C-terminal domain-containing protein n=1 Tax=Curtobacterium sp. ODYSSEY 48 V2 TaxID=2939561 RepID=UPI0035A96515